jgi:hypothetical protein
MGTAPSRYERYLLLEYGGVWPAKAWQGVEMPSDVRAVVNDALASVPGSRLQLVRQHRGQAGGVRVSVVDTRRGRLTSRVLDNHRELLELDLAGDLAAGDLQGATAQAALWLTCTHSRRDRCCAKFGLPVQAALRDRAGDAAWQASHVGGHRFAPNVLLLPHGLMLGRVTPGDVDAIVGAVEAGGLPPLAFWRGRTCLAPHVQAAEIVARTRDSIADMGAPEVVVDELGEDACTVGLRFGDGSESEVRLRARSVAPFAKSCGDEPVQLRSWVPVGS